MCLRLQVKEKTEMSSLRRGVKVRTRQNIKKMSFVFPDSCWSASKPVMVTVREDTAQGAVAPAQVPLTGAPGRRCHQPRRTTSCSLCLHGIDTSLHETVRTHVSWRTQEDCCMRTVKGDSVLFFRFQGNWTEKGDPL